MNSARVRKEAKPPVVIYNLTTRSIPVLRTSEVDKLMKAGKLNETVCRVRDSEYENYVRTHGRRYVQSITANPGFIPVRTAPHIPVKMTGKN